MCSTLSRVSPALLKQNSQHNQTLKKKTLDKIFNELKIQCFPPAGALKLGILAVAVHLKRLKGLTAPSRTPLVLVWPDHRSKYQLLMVNVVVTESVTGYKSGERTALTLFPYLRLQLRRLRRPLKWSQMTRVMSSFLQVDKSAAT